MEFYASKIKSVRDLCIVSAFFSLGAFVAYTFPTEIAGWFLIVMSTPAIVSLTRNFSRRGPQVIINKHGIDDRREKHGPIPWEDIRTVSRTGLGIWLQLADQEKYGSAAVCIDFDELTPGWYEAWCCIRTHMSAADHLSTEQQLARRDGNRTQTGSRPWFHWIYAMFCYSVCGGFVFQGLSKGDEGMIVLGGFLFFTSTYAIFFSKSFNLETRITGGNKGRDEQNPKG